MSLYIFKYCLGLTEAEVDELGSFDIADRLMKTTSVDQIFGVAKPGNPVSNNVFIIRADNYPQCIDLIREHKMILDASYFSRGSFGKIGNCGVDVKFGVEKNKIHTVKCEDNQGCYDVIVCFKVTEKVKDKFDFKDAMRWAYESALASGGSYNFSRYMKNLVYLD